MPDRTTVAGSPCFVVVGYQFAVLGVCEFYAYDVRREELAVRDRLDLSPILAGIGGMIERPGCASNPDVGIVCREGAERDIVRHPNRLPGFAGVERALQDAIAGKGPAGRISISARSLRNGARGVLRDGR